AEHEASMTEVRERADELRKQATLLAAEDADAFSAGIAPHRPAKATPAEPPQRAAPIPSPLAIAAALPRPTAPAAPGAAGRGARRPGREPERDERRRRRRRCSPRGTPDGAAEHRREPGVAHRRGARTGARAGRGDDPPRPRPCRCGRRRSPRAYVGMTLLDGR